MSKTITCPECGAVMDCETYQVSRIWGTYCGKATCPACSLTLRPKWMGYGTAQGVIKALQHAAEEVEQ